MGAVRHRLVALASAVIVGSGLVLAAGPTAAAAPAAPTGLDPTGGAQSSTPTLRWDASRGAVSYEVEVDDDAGFGSPVTILTAAAVAVPTRHLQSGDQHWRVRAIGSDRTVSPWSAEAAFKVAKVTKPTELLPDGTEIQQPDPPTLFWSPVRGATSYVVQVDRENDFVGAVQYTTSVPTMVIPDSLSAADGGTDYYWHVKAIKASGLESDYSDVATFSVLPLERPTIVGPGSSSSENVTDVVLDWDPVPGSQYYQLQVSTDDDFSTSTLIDEKTKVLGTRYSPSVTYDNNQYYWRVRAVDTSGNPTSWSDDGQFRRQWSDRPELMWPAPDADVTSSLFLEWEPVPLATQYELVMGSDPNFSPGTFNACEIAGTTYTPGSFRFDEVGARVLPLQDPEKCSPQPGVRTYWRVRALDRPFTKSGADAPGVAGIFSQTRSFTYRPDSLTIGGITPANGAVVDVPTLRWSPARWADTYRITVRNAAGSAVVNNVATRATSYTPVTSAALTPAAGPYTWSLTAISADGRSVSLVQQRTFSLSGSVPTSGAEPLAPLSATTDDAPTRRAPGMSWEPMLGAAYYKVQAGPAGSGTWYSHSTGDLLDTKLYWPAVTDTHTWFTKPGDYDWQVTAYDSSNQAIGVGEVATFTVAPLDTVTGVEIALDGTTIDAGDGSTGCFPDGSGDCDVIAPATPVISWEPVDDASFYLVYVSEDDKFTNLLEPLTAFPATSNTWWSPTLAQRKSAFADSEAGASYFVHVRACVTATSCGPRPVSRTPSLASLRFRKTSPAPDLEPVHLGNDGGDITFDWADYRDTNDAPIVDQPGEIFEELWSDTGEYGTQSAQWYRLQVDDNANFSSPIEEVRVDQSTYTSATKLYPEGTLHWRVQAIDADDNDLAWSAGATFTKATPAPGDLSPATGSPPSTGTAQLAWAAQPFAKTYTVELYRNGDTNFSQANWVFTKTVKQTAYVHNSPLPPTLGDQPYVWRVRVNDTADNPGTWSRAQTFHVDGAAPAAQSPTGRSFVEGDQVLLSWSSVDGASSYDVELKPSGGGTVQRISTPATAWAPPRPLGDGEWQWRVTAVDADDNAIGAFESAAIFRIDEGGPSVVSRTPTGTPRPTSVFTLTFDEPVQGASSTTVRIFLDGRKGNLPAKVTTSKGGTKVMLKPKKRLKRSTSYDIRLSPRITDTRGNPLEPYEWSFYVGG